jgi:hypothetical protein
MSIDGAARGFLLEHGADAIDHVGGTLFAHLGRVEQALAAVGAPAALRLAGLTHATYGTDGFARALIPWTGRKELRAVIGDEAEDLVYLYCACDRDRSWADLAATRTVHDRFAGGERVLGEGQLTPFVDLSVVNELDVIERDPAVLGRHGEYFRGLFARWEPVTSPAVAERVRHTVGEGR